MLKTKDATYIEVNCFDLEQFIQQSYPDDLSDFSILSDLESSNDVYHVFHVTGELDEWDEGIVNEALDGENSYWTTPHLLNDLCRQGKLLAGNYLVEVSW